MSVVLVVCPGVLVCGVGAADGSLVVVLLGVRLWLFVAVVLVVGVVEGVVVVFVFVVARVFGFVGWAVGSGVEGRGVWLEGEGARLDSVGGCRLHQWVLVRAWCAVCLVGPQWALVGAWLVVGLVCHWVLAGGWLVGGLLHLVLVDG